MSNMAPHGFKQDMPPPGGYAAIRFQRNLPTRGFSGVVVFGTVLTVCGLGFYRLGQGNNEKRELKREVAWSRIHLVPLLLAERDRDEYRRSEAALAREKEIMKDVHGWEAGKSVYSTKRYTPSNVVVL
ncbi:GRIM-19 protein [Naematelia encephala]|uniref:NADH dehydrogenase [ubiquinone] 1 alpha subcomplex subunit 13 n=1 Tax=Naematelia encephala TaxID=71784 RepID=A0A1Y2BJ64_9TREE|nr:GRIM-19 protein [Naematelia encephala]